MAGGSLTRISSNSSALDFDGPLSQAFGAAPYREGAFRPNGDAHHRHHDARAVHAIGPVGGQSAFG